MATAAWRNVVWERMAAQEVTVIVGEAAREVGMPSTGSKIPWGVGVQIDSHHLWAEVQGNNTHSYQGSWKAGLREFYMLGQSNATMLNPIAHAPFYCPPALSPPLPLYVYGKAETVLVIKIDDPRARRIVRWLF